MLTLFLSPRSVQPICALPPCVDLAQRAPPRSRFLMCRLDTGGDPWTPSVVETSRHDGSWWPAWQAWLAAASSAERVPPLTEAPGHYVTMT